MVALLAVDMGSFFNDFPFWSFIKADARQAAGIEDVHQDPNRVEVALRTALGKAELFRRGIADRAQDMGVVAGVLLQIAGNVKISQDQLVTIIKNIFWLDVPVDDGGRLLLQDIQHVQQLADQVMDLVRVEFVGL